MKKITCKNLIEKNENGELWEGTTDTGIDIKVYTKTVNGETFAYWTAEEINTLEEIESVEWAESPEEGIYFEQENASDIVNWIKLFLEENTYHNIETISLNTNLSELEEEIENRGYNIEKNGSMWTIRK